MQYNPRWERDEAIAEEQEDAQVQAYEEEEIYSEEVREEDLEKD